MREVTIDHHMDKDIVTYEGSDGQFRGVSFWGKGSHGRSTEYKEWLENRLISIDNGLLLNYNGYYD